MMTRKSLLPASSDGTGLQTMRFLVPLTLLSLSCVAAEVANPSLLASGRYTMLNIVPTSIGSEDVAAADALELYEKAGVDHPLYSMTLHPEGKPAMAKVERVVASYHRFADALKGTGVKPGILLQAIVGHWPRTDKEIEPWQRTIDIKGNAVRFCPFDPGYRAYIREVGRRLAAEHPSVILADDDVRAFSPHAECFCSLHAAEYGRRLKREFTSETMRAHVASLAYDHPDTAVFAELQKDTVLTVLKELRAGIDEVDPSIPGGCCQSGWVWERDRLPEYARVMSGGAKPFFRLGDGNYAEHSAKDDYPWLLTRSLALFARARSACDADLITEADTWPQNLWAKSGAAFHANLAHGAFIGTVGAKIWLVNCHRDGIPVTRHYTKVLADHRGYYDALGAAGAKGAQTGFVLPLQGRYPVDAIKDAARDRTEFFEKVNWVTRVFGVFGIPFRVSFDLDDESCVYALGTRKSVARFSDDDLRKMMKHRVVVEGDAVDTLLERGFGGLIGVKVASGAGTFTGERHEATGLFAPLPESSKPTLFAPVEGAETLSSLVWRPYKAATEFTRVTSAATFFRNALGGRIVCMAYHFRLGGGFCHSESRKKIMFDILSKLSDDDLEGASLNDQNMLVQVRKGGDGWRYVHSTNLNPDFTGDLRIRVKRRPGAVERLSDHGVWQKTDFSWNGGELVIGADLPLWGETAVRIRD